MKISSILFMALLSGLAIWACSAPVELQKESPSQKEDTPAGATLEAAAAPTELPDASTEATAEVPDEAVVLKVREESYETFVDVHFPDREKPSIGYRTKSKSLRLRFDSSVAAAQQVQDLAEILNRLARDYPEALTAGKLLIAADYISYPDYVERLARFAAGDKKWKRGKTPKDLHDYIEDASNEQRLFTELDRLFEAHGLVLALEGVEKCSSARPGGKGAMGKWLKDRGITGRKVVPMGCLMAWFELEPK